MRAFTRRIARVGIALSMATLSLGISATSATAADEPDAEPAPAPVGHKVIYPTVSQAKEQRENALQVASANGRMMASAPSADFTAPVVDEQLHYGGGVNGIGVTIAQPKVYLVLWGTQWGTESPAGSLNLTGDTAGMAKRVKAMFQGIGSNGEEWSRVMTQYCDGVAVGATTCPSNKPHVPYPNANVLAGVWLDTASNAPASATPNQIALKAREAAAHFGNTTAASNRNAQYVIMSPHGTHPDGFGTDVPFCAWHDYTGDPYVGPVSSSYGDLAFTNLPYILDEGADCGANLVNAGAAGALDGVTMVEGHEYAETITDQNPPGGWVDNDDEENADKCAWIVGEGVYGAQNVAFSTGSFAMQSTWSNETGDCRIGKPAPVANDFALIASPIAGFAAAGSSTSTLVTSVTTNGNSQTVALSVSGLPSGATASFSPSSSITPATYAQLTVQTAAGTPAGEYPITITGVGTATRNTTFVLVVAAPLTNGVTRTGLAGPVASVKYFYIDVPAGVGALDVVTSGGTGDVDLYVEHATQPGDTDDDCLSDEIGNAEACEFDAPEAGRWIVALIGYDAYANVSLTATYGSAFAFSIGVQPAAISVAPGGVGTATVTTSLLGGSSRAIELSASIDGVGFSPDTVPTGGSSTVSVSIPAGTAPGVYPVTIWGDTASVYHSTVLAVTVTGAGSPGGGATNGYWMLGSGGTVYNFGSARSVPNYAMGGAVDIEPTPSGNGTWVVNSVGMVFPSGDAGYYGDAAGKLFGGESVTSISRSASGHGYWLFTSKGRALRFGDAPALGDMSGVPLNGPVLDSVSTPSGLGYYMVASDGGVFSFGDAKFYGSMGGKKLNAPVQSLVPDGDGVGYWLVASDGGIFAFDAPFRGSMGGIRLNRPITGMVRFGNGYLMVGEDGGIFNFSDRPFYGSLGGTPPLLPIVAVAAI